MIRGTHASTAQYKRHVLYDKILNGGRGVPWQWHFSPLLSESFYRLRGKLAAGFGGWVSIQFRIILRIVTPQFLQTIHPTSRHLSQFRVVVSSSRPRSDPDLLEGDALLRAREGLGALQAPN